MYPLRDLPDVIRTRVWCIPALAQKIQVSLDCSGILKPVCEVLRKLVVENHTLEQQTPARTEVRLKRSLVFKFKINNRPKTMVSLNSFLAENAKGGGGAKGGNLTSRPQRKTVSDPPHLGAFPLPLLSISSRFSSISVEIPRTSPRQPLRNSFGGSPKWVSKGTSSRGFALLYVPPFSSVQMPL